MIPTHGLTPVGRKVQNPLLSRTRRLCLSLPETTEAASWGHPNFRAGKRTFVTFEVVDGVDTIAFHLHPFEVEELERRSGFVRTPHGQGRWVSLRLRPRPKWPDIEALVLRSYRQVALKRMLVQLEEAGTTRVARKRPPASRSGRA